MTIVLGINASQRHSALGPARLLFGNQLTNNTVSENDSANL